MRRYKDLSGTSRIHGYYVRENQLTIRFQDGSIYKYDEMSTGLKNLEAMIALAECGKGLDTFIEQYVQDSYSLRLK